MMQPSSQTTEIIRSEDIQALAKLRGDEGPVFSLFLNIGPDKNSPGDLAGRFDRLLRKAEQERKLDQAFPVYQKQWKENADLIRTWLADNPGKYRGGLAVFCSTEVNLWRAYQLTVPVADRLIVRDSPQVRPIEILLNELQKSLVILLDASGARLVEVFSGKALEVQKIPAIPVTGTAGQSDMDRLVEQIGSTFRGHGADWLMIGAAGEARTALREALPAPLRMRISGEMDLSPQPDMDDILAEVRGLESEMDRKVETNRLADYINTIKTGGAAAQGLDQTLLAIRSGRVRLLLVEEDFHLEGGVCPNCGFIGEGDQKICMLCEMALRPDEDIIEAACKTVLDKGAEIEIVRSPALKGALQPYGQIGALLNDPGTLPLEKTAAGQQPISEGGTINRDTVHDEAIEESFPASDPPGR